MKMIKITSKNLKKAKKNFCHLIKSKLNQKKRMSIKKYYNTEKMRAQKFQN